MNLGEAMFHVLRTKGQSLIQDFWKEDLSSLFSDVLSEGARSFRESRSKLRDTPLKSIPGNIIQSSAEILHVATVLPGRIRKGLTEFQKDMIVELETKTDAKEKAIFCFRVLGILTSSTAGTFYNLRKPGEFRLGKLRIRSALAKFLVAEFVLRSLRLFLRRFLKEMEKDLTSPEDLDNVRYFRRLMEGGKIEEEISSSEQDPAFRITERLKNIILNGDDES